MVITLPVTRAGLYSEEAAAMYGTAIYKSLDGTHVHVTGAPREEKSYIWAWPDAVRVGWVTSYVCPGKASQNAIIWWSL